MKYDMRELPIVFYDERLGNHDDVRDFIVKQIEGVRQNHAIRIDEVASTVDKVANNVKDAKAKAAYSETLKTLIAWIETHKQISPVGKIHHHLIDTILERQTYAASVRASVNRYGSWHNLDYYYQIGFGTRTETVKTISGMLSELYANISTMQARGDLEPAHEFLHELKIYCKSEAEQLYKEIQRLGKDIYREKLQKREDLWRPLQQRWGQGPGYKIDIANSTETWFAKEEHKKVHSLIQNKIVKSWMDMLSKIEELAKGVFD
jgi:hypothetical protein